MSDETLSAGLTRALARGSATVDKWCADGTLVEAAEVERKRGAAVTEVALAAVATRSLRADVARVNQRLAALPSSEELLFWLVAHSALRGLRPDQAMQAGRVERVQEHAEAWAAERRPPS